MAQPTSPAANTEGGFDAFLGSAHTRYLGEGHRRVELQVFDLDFAGSDAYEAIANVSYPRDWSTKAGQSRVPHLSTVDAMRISSRIESSLASTHEPMLNEYSLQQSLTVRAGARPWETLERVPVRTTIEHRPDDDSFRLTHSVGSLKVETIRSRANGPHVIDDAWSAGKATAIELGSEVDVTCRYERRATIPSGLSFLEALMLTAQMSQVALYGGDAARRDRSGNMWMRRASFLRHEHRVETISTVALRLQDQRELTVGGRGINTADVLAEDVFGIQVTASLAMGS